MTLTFVLFLILPLIMIAAGISDLLSYRIPNELTAILGLSFIPFALSAGLPWSVIGMHAGLAFVVLFIGFLLFSKGWLGAGDAKLLAASSLWISGPDFLSYMLIIALAGGILSLFIFLWRTLPMPDFILNIKWIHRIYTPSKEGRDVPYAVAMLAGLLWVMPHLKVLELATQS